MSPEEKVNRKFEALLKRYGAYELERRIHKMESWRRYDSKYPYDSTTKAKSIDDALNLHDGSNDLLDEIIANESREEFLATLTPMQREVAEELEKGLKPRDIARGQGKEDSGSVRWLKNAAKKRFIEHLEGDGTDVDL